MAEPKVGMIFNNYYGVTRRGYNNARTVKIDSRESDLYRVYNEEYISPNNEFIGSTSVYKWRTENRQDVVACYDSLKYEGSGTLDENTAFMKFTKIKGTQTYAVDINKNNIVDEGEIFPY